MKQKKKTNKQTKQTHRQKKQQHLVKRVSCLETNQTNKQTNKHTHKETAVGKKKQPTKQAHTSKTHKETSRQRQPDTKTNIQTHIKPKASKHIIELIMTQNRAQETPS